MQKSLTRRELYAELVEMSGEDIGTVRNVLGALALLVEQEVRNGTAISVPGVARVKPVYLKPRPKRRYINPRTGEELVAAAVPARTKVRARPAASLRQVLPGPRSIVGKQLAKVAR